MSAGQPQSRWCPSKPARGRAAQEGPEGFTGLLTYATSKFASYGARRNQPGIGFSAQGATLRGACTSSERERLNEMLPGL